MCAKNTKNNRTIKKKTNVYNYLLFVCCVISNSFRNSFIVTKSLLLVVEKLLLLLVLSMSGSISFSKSIADELPSDENDNTAFGTDLE